MLPKLALLAKPTSSDAFKDKYVPRHMAQTKRQIGIHQHVSSVAFKDKYIPRHMAQTKGQIGIYIYTHICHRQYTCRLHIYMPYTHTSAYLRI